MSQEYSDLARHLLEFAISLYPEQKRGWQSKFAQRLGVTPQQLSDMLNGRKGIGEVQQKRLADLGMNLNWLIAGKGSMHDPEERQFVRMVRETINEQGGEMPSAAEAPTYTYFPISAAKPEDIRAIAVPDDSMAGVVWDGDTIFVRREAGFTTGDLCLVKTTSGYKIRNLYIRSDRALLTATNADPESIPISDLLSVHSVIAATIEGVRFRRK